MCGQNPGSTKTKLESTEQDFAPWFQPRDNEFNGGKGAQTDRGRRMLKGQAHPVLLHGTQKWRSSHIHRKATLHPTDISWKPPYPWILVDLVRLWTGEQRNSVSICFVLICNIPAHTAEYYLGLQFAGQKWVKGVGPIFSCQLRAELHFTGPPPCTDLAKSTLHFAKRLFPFNGKSEALNALESNGLAKLGSEYSDHLNTSTGG